MPRIRDIEPSHIAEVERFLQGRLEHSMFLLSNLQREGLANRGGPWHGSHAAAWEGERVVGVASHYGRGHITVSAPACAVEVAQAVLESSRRPLSGVVGPEDEVDAIEAALHLRAATASCDERETLYRLSLDELTVPRALAEGAVRGRPLASADLEQVVAWTVRYRVETVGDEETEALWRDARASLSASVDGGKIWVLEAGGKLLAKTAFNAQLPDAVQIGGVWVPHDLRGRGYGRCAVASHLLWARERGVQLGILFTGDHNRPAQRAYEALSFTPIGRYRVLLLSDPIAA